MCSDCDDEVEYENRLKQERKKLAKQKHDWLSYLWFYGTEKQFKKWLEDICDLKRSNEGYFLGDHTKIAEGADKYQEPAERALDVLKELLERTKTNGTDAGYQSGLGSAIRIVETELSRRNGF